MAVAAACGFSRTQVWVNRVSIEVSGSVAARGQRVGRRTGVVPMRVERPGLEAGGGPQVNLKA